MAAEFREAIVPAIPKIIALLSDEDQDVRWKATKSLEKFVERGNVPNLGRWRG